MDFDKKVIDIIRNGIDKEVDEEKRQVVIQKINEIREYDPENKAGIIDGMCLEILQGLIKNGEPTITAVILSSLTPSYCINRAYSFFAKLDNYCKQDVELARK